MKNGISILLVVICLGTNLSAQNEYRQGYIITLQYDTLHGFIQNNDYGKNSKICEFKQDSDDQTVTYKPFDIIAYQFDNGKYYFSKTIFIDGNREDVFLEYLIKGKLNIYYQRREKGDYYFAEKENDSLLLLTYDNVYYDYNWEERKYEPVAGKTNLKYRESTKYMGILKYLMADYPQLTSEIEHTELNRKSLINLAQDYHYLVCNDEDCVIYEKQVKPIVVLAIEGQYSSLEYMFKMYRYKQTDHLNFGLSVNTQIVPLSEKVFFGAALLFGSFRAEDEKEAFFYELKGKDLHLTAQMHINLMQRPFTPFLGGGLVFSRLLNTQVYSHQRNYPNGPLTEELEVPDDYKSIFLGGIISGGVQYTLNNRIILEINGFYSFQGGKLDKDLVLNYGLGLNVGYNIRNYGKTK
jgi:hypothetical protein